MINQICTLLQDKKILILGYGREGKSTYQFIRKHFPDKVVGIYDKNALPDTLQKVVSHGGNSFLEILSEYDIIFKTPGIVLDTSDNSLLKKITSQTDIFLDYYRKQTIGITGTKGKSTTASLLNHILKNAKKDAILVGNIGIPVFDMLEKIGKDTIVVFELSSHQLEYVTHSPHIGVLLNIYQEHLDHYGTFEKYVEAKENIFLFQQQGDVLIYNREFIKNTENIKAEQITITNHSDDADAVVKENKISYQGQVLEVNEEELLLKGQHNIYNIGVAYVVAKLCNVTDIDFEMAIKTFRPLPHRMEYVADINGVKFYNDSISTICETTIQAALSIENIDTVILGGLDRGIEYEPLVEFLLDSDIRNIILMPDTGIRIEKLFKSNDKKRKDQNIRMVSNVEEAVTVAKEVTAWGKTCLFSPAAASYGFFKNFEERGEVFKKFVLNN
ncbi:MAG: UDP-N-acetylmuramoyl-L-alanine--D-glutamate ligase [Herbinix sp.]|nr:UDP-N-acetylmuramoyl-L-alanine--D-glutamate ligase [Herbinix sp.]